MGEYDAGHDAPPFAVRQRDRVDDDEKLELATSHPLHRDIPGD
jgi:hypothetical protein